MGCQSVGGFSWGFAEGLGFMVRVSSSSQYIGLVRGFGFGSGLVLGLVLVSVGRVRP